MAMTTNMIYIHVNIKDAGHKNNHWPNIMFVANALPERMQPYCQWDL